MSTVNKNHKTTQVDLNLSEKLTKSTTALVKEQTYQLSDDFVDCNIRTETETNWVPVRQKVKRRIIPIQEMGIYFLESFPSLRDLDTQTLGYPDKNNIKDFSID